MADLYWTDMPGLLALPGAQVGRDTAADSPFLRYSLDGDEHEVWYEDTASIRAKASLAGRYHLGGIAVWALGQENANFWQAAHEPLQDALD